MNKQFDVLLPTYERTGGQLTSTFIGRDGSVRHSIQDVWRIGWICIGQATDMKDAKAKFGGAPVLERRQA